MDVSVVMSINILYAFLITPPSHIKHGKSEIDNSVLDFQEPLRLLEYIKPLEIVKFKKSQTQMEPTYLPLALY